MNSLINLAHPEQLYDNVGSTFIPLSVIHIILSFILLGICASDFLCPNVATITDSHRRSTGNLMSVLLSWCNSSPDLFANFISWTSTNSDTSNQASLSIGEVLGACGIILCVVIGSIFMIMSSVNLEITPMQRHNMLKDLFFVTIAISMILKVCLRNRISFIDCIMMVTLYLVYLLSKFHYKFFKTTTLIDEEQINDNQLYDDDEDDNDELFPSYVKPNIIAAMDFNNLLSILENSSNTGYADQTELQTLTNNNFQSKNINQSLRPNTEPIIHQSHKMISYSDLPEHPKSSPSTFAPYSDNPITNDRLNDNTIFANSIPDLINQPKTSPLIRKSGITLKKFRKNLIKKLLPHLSNFKTKSILDKILSILTLPFIIILRLSCPQFLTLIEYDMETENFIYETQDIVFLFCQSIISPIFTLILIACLIAKSPPFIFTILTLCIIIFLACFVLTFYQKLLQFNKFSLFSSAYSTSVDSPLSNKIIKNKNKKIIDNFYKYFTIIFLSIGIINSILWISIFANSLIEILDIYQKITGISKAILGLTIFAWGNSVSDLISNIAMCKLYHKAPVDDINLLQKTATKFFIIACSSCCGGVLLNSMGGIGVSALAAMLFVNTSSSKWWILRHIELSETGTIDYKFIVSSITIILQIIALALYFSNKDILKGYLNNNMKFVGMIMCCSWGIATMINIVLECFS